MKKDYAAALQARLREIERAGDTPEAMTAVRDAFVREGWPDVLKGILAQNNGVNIETAQIYAQLGDKDKAFGVLDKAADRRAVMLVHIAHDPRLDPLRDDPRFEQLLKRLWGDRTR